MCYDLVATQSNSIRIVSLRFYSLVKMQASSSHTRDTVLEGCVATTKPCVFQCVMAELLLRTFLFCQKKGVMKNEVP